MEGAEILGVVQHAHVVDNVLEFSRVRPTHIYRENGWEPITARIEEFPSQGLVIWFKPDSLALDGTFWFFRVVRQPKYNPESRKFDAWQVDQLTAQPAIEGVEIEGAPEATILRRKLADGSLNSLARDTVGPVLLRVPRAPDRWIGPIALNAADRRALRPSVVEGYLEVRQIPESSFDVFVVDGVEHRLLRSERPLGPKSGFFNVQRDEALLRGVADFVRKSNPGVADALGVTRKLAEEYAAALEKVGNGTPARLQSIARLEAVRELVDASQAEWNLDEETMSFLENKLAALPCFRADIEKIRERELTSLRAEVRETVDAEFSETRSKLELMRAQHASVRDDVLRLRTEMRTAADSLVADIVPKMTENVLVRAIIGAGMTRGSEGPLVAPVDLVPVSKIETRGALVSATRLQAASAGISADVLRRSTFLLSASSLLLATGRSASRLATAVAQLLSNDHAVRASVSTTMFDLAALLAAPCAAVGASSFPACSLGEFLSGAAERGSLSVVILEGCNRAPPENVFQELADSIPDGAGCRSVAWSDRDGKIRSATLDGRVVFVCTLMDGQTVFPFSSALAYRWPVVWADKEPAAESDDSLRDVPSADPTSVSISMWRDLVAGASSKTPPWTSALRTSVRGFDSVRRLGDYLARVASASGLDEVGFAEGLAALVVGRHTQKDLDAIGTFLPEGARQHFNAVAMFETGRLKEILEGKKGS